MSLLRTLLVWGCIYLNLFTATVLLAQSSEALPETLKEIYARHPLPCNLSVSAIDEKGKTILHWKETASLASASAIKTALLVELFDEFQDQLDEEANLELLLESAHPAISHFSRKQQDEIRSGLRGVSYRRIGKIMMGAEPASNLVYNAAANMTIGLLGGPDESTSRIHRRSQLLNGLIVRRYMLAPRDQPGDNVATAKSLCQLWHWIGLGKIPGLSESRINSVKDAILHSERRHGLKGQHVFKDGSLDSDPMVRVYAGTVRHQSGLFAYTIMLEQPAQSRLPRDEAIKELERTTLVLVQATMQQLKNDSQTMLVYPKEKRVIAISTNSDVDTRTKFSIHEGLDRLIRDMPRFQQVLGDPFSFLKELDSNDLFPTGQTKSSEMASCNVSRESKTSLQSEFSMSSSFFEEPALLTTYDRISLSHASLIVRSSEVSESFRLLNPSTKPISIKSFSLHPEIFRQISNGRRNTKLQFMQRDDLLIVSSTEYGCSSISLIHSQTLDRPFHIFFGGELYESILHNELSDWIRIDVPSE